MKYKFTGKKKTLIVDEKHGDPAHMQIFHDAADLAKLQI